MSLGEFELISRYFKRGQSPHKADVGVGIGDDAAVLEVPNDHQLVVSVDALVEGVHFLKDADADLVAQKALRVNLSDMAAMGATPRWFTLALTLPKADEVWVANFSDGLFSDADAFGCALVGGDTTKGPLNIAIQILGTLETSKPALTRKGAAPGDLLVVTGTLGDAMGALESGALESGLNDKAGDFLSSRYWHPEPRVEFAQKARDYISATCDISDGLLADVEHICEASLVGVKVDVALLPLSEQLKSACGKEGAEILALTGGDDYELCMAVPPHKFDDLKQVAEGLSVPVTKIGIFCEGEGLTCVHSGDEKFSLQAINAGTLNKGYTHF